MRGIPWYIPPTQYCSATFDLFFAVFLQAFPDLPARALHECIVYLLSPEQQKHGKAVQGIRHVNGQPYAGPYSTGIYL